MADRPANAGADRGLAGAPSPVHHQGFPRRHGTPPGHRARTRNARNTKDARNARDTKDARNAKDSRATAGEPDAPATRTPASWLPYLIVLAGVAAGMFVIWQGSKYAGRGASLIGASLLAGALARLILPERYAGLLSSRRKASDVLAFAAFGAAVLAVAIALP